MNSVFPVEIIRAIFWPSLILDYLLLTSFLFLFLYPAGLLLASCLPRAWKARPAPGWLPLLWLVCLSLPMTGIGNYCASALKHYILPVLREVPIIVAEDYIFISVCLVIWLGGCAWRLLAAARHCLALRRLLRRSAEAAPDPVFLEALRAVQPGLPVRLKESAGLGSAASWRLGRAWVLVPRGFGISTPAAARYAVYLHELGHIKRRDSLKLLLLLLLKIPLWFNPLFLHAARRFQSHLEIACDHTVLESGTVNLQDYAELILSSAGRQNCLAPGFSGAMEQTAHRLRYIFHDPAFRPPLRDRLRALCCIAAVGLVLLPYGEGPLPRQPWGEVSQVTLPDGQVLTLDVTLDWHGVLGSYVIADDAPADAVISAHKETTPAIR